MKKKTKNNLLLLFSVFISLSLFSQETKHYKGLIKNDAEKGFKAVALTPNIRVIANADLSDLRILDAENQQTPYFLQENNYKVFKNFIPVKNTISFGKKHTTVIIKNLDKESFEYFTFKISNAKANKTCKIVGSDNNKEWFVISEKIHLTLNNNTESTFNYYNIQFPSIDYKYIKLVINDSLSAPINIKNIGYFDSKTIQKENTFTILEYKYVISQKEKSTLIHIQANSAFEINKIDFAISGPELYKRDISFYTLKTINKKEVKQAFNSFTLNSENTNSFRNLNSKHKDFWIKIDNKDNQILIIDSINFYQKTTYLVADLKPNKEYTITAGDKKLTKPSYDLVNFKNKIDADLSLINIENEQFHFEKNNTKEIKKSFYEQAWFMWISIGLVALIILFFTLSLAKKTEEID